LKSALRGAFLLVSFLKNTLSGNVMKTIALMSILLAMAGCSLFQPAWHWSRPGASEADYEVDIRFCKSQTDQAIDGTVTNASVRRIHGCMERRGWRKVENE